MSTADNPTSHGEPEGKITLVEGGVGKETTTGFDATPLAVAPSPVQRWNDRIGLATVAGCLIVAATSWYLLKEFASLLRPLLLAVFLCYVILPIHGKLKRYIPTLASVVLLAGLSVGFIVFIAWHLLGSAVDLNEDMPRLLNRAQAILHDAERYYTDHLPNWLQGMVNESARGQLQVTNQFKQMATGMAGAAADALTEAGIVGIYLMFLLVEAGRVPHRIQDAFSDRQPDRILGVVGNINRAMADYLRIKVAASLVLAMPVTILLWIFDVRFALMWGMLTFLLNFIPYLGSIIACSGPIALAYLQLESAGKPTVLAVILISIHITSAYVVEPALTGKAIGISPLVILVSLSFWGLCWGITGMLLAVPLTVMLKIVLENVAFTRPLARLMAEE